MIMKKQILSLVAVLVLGSSACMAQNPQRDGRDRRGGMMERMKTELSLSDEQVAQMKEIFSEMRPQQQGERPTREQMQKRREEMTAKIKKVLTEEQYAKYEKMRKERRPNRPQNGGGTKIRRNQYHHIQKSRLEADGLQTAFHL